MFRKSVFVFLVVATVFVSRASAQEGRLLVADDSSSGTYAQMLKEIKGVCSGDVTIEEVKVSGGALGNLDALKNNEASIAFLHSDVIFAAAQGDPAARQLKTLVALYPEEIHVVALKASGIKTGGTMGFGGKTKEFNSLGDLRGYKVGAAGGGAITAKLIQGQGEAGFSVVVKDKGSELIQALDSGEIQAAIIVGGAPLKSVRDLDGNKYKLLPIPDAIAGKLSGIYRPATINYPSMKSGPIRTLAPDAVVLTRQYRSPRMVAPQRAFRDCFYRALDDLKETPGMHRKWQEVNAENHGTWEWLEIAGSSPPAQSAEQAPKPLPRKR